MRVDPEVNSWQIGTETSQGLTPAEPDLNKLKIRLGRFPLQNIETLKY